LGNEIARELVGLINIDLIRGRDTVTIPRLKSIAKNLDIVTRDVASSQVEARLKELHRQVAQERLNYVGTALARASDPSMMTTAATQVLSSLLDAQPHVREVPELVTVMLHHCTNFSEKVIECLLVMAESDTSLFRPFGDIAAKLDAMAQVLARQVSTSWPPLAARVEEIRLQKAMLLVPTTLDSFELEIERAEQIEPRKLLKILDTLLPLWTDQPQELTSRLTAALQKLEISVTTAFDRALAAGEGSRLDMLVGFAKDLDQRRAQLAAEVAGVAAAEPFSRGLETRKAGVTLRTLFENAEGNVAARSRELHEAFREAESRVKATQPRERLKERAEEYRWKFRLGNGSFKDYSAARSAEVEALYQDWLDKGKPSDVESRRYEIKIQVASAPSRVESREPSIISSTSTSLPPETDTVKSSEPVGRPRCKYGEKCFRKNAQHRKDFSHPGDDDWPTNNAGDAVREEDSLLHMPMSNPGLGVGVAEETFSLDFLLMTQVNLSRRGRGMRRISRVEGMTFAQQHTHEYFVQVVQFVKEAEDMLAKAEVELRLLGDSERERMQAQVDQLLPAMRPALSEFLGLAVFIEDMKVIDDVVAMLGVHAEGLGIKSVLKQLRMRDVLDELKLAYKEKDVLGSSQPQKWDLLRLMWKHQAVVGPLYYNRCGIVKTKQEIQTLTRRHVQIRCQALLSEYADDAEFGAEFRFSAVEVLAGAARLAAARGSPETLRGILQTAASWQCDVAPLCKSAETFMRKSLGDAAGSRLQPLGRVIEVLDLGQEIAKAAHKQLAEVCNLTPFTGQIAEKAFGEVNDLLDKAHDPLKMPASVNQLVELRTKLRSNDAATQFDAEFWALFKVRYEEGFTSSTETQTRAIEWSMAFCEQLKQPLPPWMMNKDQVEALRKLESAMTSGEEGRLREAVVFAKQTDYKSDSQLSSMYEKSVEQLRKLKRLPSGWEMDGLVGDDAKAKMFKKVDLAGDTLISLFQQIFDKTNAGIVTRDRKEAMPRGYRVQKVESVWNVDSWSSYVKRLDGITDQCSRFPGSAPVEDWSGWSGNVATDELGKAILTEARLPSLENSANEFLMFHGTNPDAANLIAQNHFDMAFACKTGLFGAGLYFAESSSKSDEYVKPDARNHFPVIMCRVTLGRVNYVPNPDPTTDPGRDKLESSCLRGDYHSVLGDRKKARGTYREFIVYDHYQVYPHFIVWYTRLSG